MTETRSFSTRDHSLGEILARLPDMAAADATLGRLGHGCTATLLIEAPGDDGGRWYLTIVDGALREVAPGPILMRPVDLTFTAAAEDWARFWAPLPERGWQDFFAMTKSGALRIEGDFPLLLRHLRFIRALLSLPRGPSQADAAPAEPVAIGEIEPVLGRYVHVEIAGRRNRVYFEEAGEGPPLLCLHTAGADARQFRFMLNDPEITRRFRVIAFDLPWHGKSSPPVGFEDETYRLTTDLYVETIMAVSRVLRLERPVVLGCSIGGRIVLELARRHPEAFTAAIGVESAAHQQPWYDTAYLNRPDIHGGAVCADLVAGMVAPQSPDACRWETLWHYMQGGPGIFQGDLYFYREDSDFRDRVAEIDTARCPVFMLTGEYDFSCRIEDSVATAARMRGVTATPMREMGHFPMSENPARFAEYLYPVLDRIASRASHS